MKKVLSFFIALLAIAGIGAFLSSCDEPKDIEGEHRTHIAVQVEDYGPWSIVDRNGEIVARDAYPKEARISDVYDGVYWVNYERGVFLLYNVKEPNKPLCDTCIAVTEFATGRAVVAMKGKPLQIIDLEGKVIKELPEDYCYVSALNSEGAAWYKKKPFGCGIINRNGDVLMEELTDNPLLYSLSDGVGIFDNGTIVSYEGDFVGSINLRDYQITHNKVHYSEGLVGLRKKNGRETVYFDKQGIEAFTIEDFFPTDFHDGYAVNENKVIDKQGNVLIDTYTKYDRIYYLSQGKFIKYEDDIYSIIDDQGNELCRLDDEKDVYGVTMLGADRFLLFGGGCYYRMYDMQGKRIGENTFDNISESPCYDAINYINPNDIANYVFEELGSISIAINVDSLMNKAGMNMKTATYRRGISIASEKFDIPLSINYVYNGEIARSFTHKEQRGGYIYTITDGYGLTGALLKSFTLSFQLGDVDRPCTVDGLMLVNAIKQKLKDNGYEELDNGVLYTEGADPIKSNNKLLKGVTVDFSCPNRVTYLTVKCRIAFE